MGDDPVVNNNNNNGETVQQQQQQHDHGESLDQFPQMIENEVISNGGITVSERRKRLR